MVLIVVVDSPITVVEFRRCVSDRYAVCCERKSKETSGQSDETRISEREKHAHIQDNAQRYNGVGTAASSESFLEGVREGFESVCTRSKSQSSLSAPFLDLRLANPKV